MRAGEGMATLRIGPATALRVVDAVLTGVHEPGTSHHELLRAFVDDATLRRVDTELMVRGLVEADRVAADRLGAGGECRPVAKPPHIVMILDEWESAGHFQQFFSNPELQTFIAEVGADAAPPELTVAEAVASPDAF